MEFDQVLNADTLTIYLNKKQSELNSFVSLAVNNGVKLHTIKVYDADGVRVPMIRDLWNVDDVILHNGCSRLDYSAYQITESPVVDQVYIYPNPSDKASAKLHFETMSELQVSVSVHDMKGRTVCIPVSGKSFNLGVYEIDLSFCSLSAGLYILTAKIGEEEYILKWVNE